MRARIRPRAGDIPRRRPCHFAGPQGSRASRSRTGRGGRRSRPGRLSITWAGGRRTGWIARHDAAVVSRMPRRYSRLRWTGRRIWQKRRARRRRRLGPRRMRGLRSRQRGVLRIALPVRRAIPGKAGLCGHSPGPHAVAAAGRMLAIMNGISAKLALRQGLLFPGRWLAFPGRGVRGRVSRGRAFCGRAFRARDCCGRAFRARDCCRRARCRRRLRLSPLGPFLLQFPPGRLPAVRLPSRGPLWLIPVTEFSVRERVFGTARRPSPAQSRRALPVAGRVQHPVRLRTGLPRPTPPGTCGNEHDDQRNAADQAARHHDRASGDEQVRSGLSSPALDIAENARGQARYEQDHADNGQPAGTARLLRAPAHRSTMACRHHSQCGND
jgi:hypothetical protein